MIFPAAECSRTAVLTRSISCEAGIAMGVSRSSVNPCRIFLPTNFSLPVNTSRSCSRVGTGYSSPLIPITPDFFDRGRRVTMPVRFNAAMVRAYSFSIIGMFNAYLTCVCLPEQLFELLAGTWSGDSIVGATIRT